MRYNNEYLHLLTNFFLYITQSWHWTNLTGVPRTTSQSQIFIEHTVCELRIIPSILNWYWESRKSVLDLDLKIRTRQKDKIKYNKGHNLWEFSKAHSKFFFFSFFVFPCFIGISSIHKGILVHSLYKHVLSVFNESSTGKKPTIKE